MTFNEQNVNREQDGKFGEKTGGAPEINLDAPAKGYPHRRIPIPSPELAAIYDLEDNPRPEDYEAASVQARKLVRNELWPVAKDSDDPRLEELMATEPWQKTIERNAARNARLAAPQRAAELGIPHPADAHLDAIWAGKAMGFGEEKTIKELAAIRKLRVDLQERRATPREVIGTGYKGDTRKLANEYLDRTEAAWQLSLDTRGRSNTLNVSNAFHHLKQDGGY